MPSEIPSDLGARVSVTTAEMEDAAAGVADAAVTTRPPPPTCPVCMEPWTCNGDHRICCIPCGHVYGRSCLEMWLHRSTHDTAKCPQCGEQFHDKLITNLYAPGNLWDGCCRLQEIEAHYKCAIKEMEGRTISVLTEYTGKFESKLDRLSAEMKEAAAEAHAENAELKEQNAKIRAILKKQNAMARAEMESFFADEVQALDQIKKLCNEKMAAANTNMALTKEQMKKMAEEENATATDLIEFVERSFPQLALIVNL